MNLKIDGVKLSAEKTTSYDLCKIKPDTVFQTLLKGLTIFLQPEGFSLPAAHTAKNDSRISLLASGGPSWRYFSPVKLLLQLLTSSEKIVSTIGKAIILKSYSPICEKRIL
jgi:hypothetical protein